MADAKATNTPEEMKDLKPMNDPEAKNKPTKGKSKKAPKETPKEAPKGKGKTKVNKTDRMRIYR